MLETGICIPQKYSSYLTPIYSPKLFSQLMALSKEDHMAFEKTYVVFFNGIVNLSDDILPVFHFSHEPSTNIVNIGNGKLQYYYLFYLMISMFLFFEKKYSL